MKKTTINANGTEIKIFGDIINEEAYLCITDIAKRKNPEDANGVIANWLRSRSTIEFLGLWEQFHNLDFNPLEFEGVKNEAGGNTFTMSPKKWIENTNAIGIVCTEE